MSNELTATLKSDIEKQRIIKTQLTALQKKVDERRQQAADLSESLARAKADHEACVLANLAGNASDKELEESEANLKRLADSIAKVTEPFEHEWKIRDRLSLESFDLEGIISANRSILCQKLLKECYAETAENKKINARLAAGYAGFLSSGELNKSWLQFLLCNFPHPSEHGMKIAIEKFKADHEFMRD